MPSQICVVCVRECRIQRRGFSVLIHTHDFRILRVSLFSIPLHSPPTMPPRQPLSKVAPQRPRGTELSPYLRGRIVESARQGESQSAIAKRLDIPRSTVQNTIKVNGKRVDGKTQPRSGRPRKTDARDFRRLQRYMATNQKATYDMILADTELPVGKTSLKEMLKSLGMKK